MTSESDLSADQPDWLPPDVDVSRPNAARVYDVYVGGAHNFQIDREFAKRAKELLPEVRTTRSGWSAPTGTPSFRAVISC